MRRLALISLVTAVLTAAPAGVALANNDPFTPGDDCAASANAIGHPSDPFGANNGVDVVEARGGDNPVDAPASNNNPGQSDGANGQASSQGPAHCTNA
jgi:hypothetical protein